MISSTRNILLIAIALALVITISAFGAFWYYSEDISTYFAQDIANDQDNAIIANDDAAADDDKVIIEQTLTTTHPTQKLTVVDPHPVHKTGSTVSTHRAKIHMLCANEAYKDTPSCR